MTLSHRLPPSPSSHPKLVSSNPTASVPARVRISHLQLRDLIVCPAERGVLWYVSDNSILEQDIISNTRPRTITELKFTPVTLSTLRLASSCPGGKDVIVLAAGGQDAELFLGMYLYHPRRTRQGKRQPSAYESSPLNPRPSESLHLSEGIEVDDEETDVEVKEEEEEEDHAGYSTSVWQHTSSLVGSINNNVLLYMPPPPLHEHDLYEDNEEDRAVSPRLVVSNNDCTVKFFDVCLARKGLKRPPALQRPQERAVSVDTRYWRQDPGYAYRAAYEGEGWEKGNERVVRYERVGCLRLPVPVNHTSISPDGSTVLSCGDASTIYLHRILPVRDGSTLLFEPLATYTVPPPTPLPPLPPPTTSPPSSSTSQRRTLAPRYSGQNDPGGQYLPFAFVNGSWVLAGPHPYLNDVPGVEIPPACFTTAWSADGMRFAVASQEGMVRVWDVRSKEPLGCAGWETGPGGAAAAAAASASSSGSTREPSAITDDSRLRSALAAAALNYDTQRALFEFTGGAPPWGVRSLKFARNASGREVLVFTEHVSRVHVIDADTFSRHDVLRIPHVQPSVSASPRDQPPNQRHHHHHRSSGARLPVFRPPPTSTAVGTPVGPSSMGSILTPAQAQFFGITPADLPRWMDGGGGTSATAAYSYLPRFMIDTSAVWRGAGPGEDFPPTPAPRTRPRIDGGNPSGTDTPLSPRLANRLEGRARARRLGLVPPRISQPESEQDDNSGGNNNSTARRVLSPSLPLSRSPDPTGAAPFRTSLHDYGVEPERSAAEEDWLNSGSDTDYQAFLRSQYPASTSTNQGSSGSAADATTGGRAAMRSVTVRSRAREILRARRQLEEQEGGELRRRSPASSLRARDDTRPAGAGVVSAEAGRESRLRDDAQMEEDIAFHAAREREQELQRERDRDAELLYRIREVRERIQAGRERTQAREQEERERGREELEREREREATDPERGPVVIPPLSSTRSEEDVQSVLAAHGISSVRSQALSSTSETVPGLAETHEENADDTRSEHSQGLLLPASDEHERRPGSSSSASTSTSSAGSAITTSSISGVTGYTGITGVSTRAQAGSLVGEVHSASANVGEGVSTVPYPSTVSEANAGNDYEPSEAPSTRRRRLDSSSLMTPSIRNMRAAQAALRAMDEALDEYRMEVDETEGPHVDSAPEVRPEQDVDLDEDRDAEGEEEESDSDATELECTEPTSIADHGESAEVSVSSSTSAALSSSVPDTTSTTEPPSSSPSASSPTSSSPSQPTHSRSQSLPLPLSSPHQQPRTFVRQQQQQSQPQTQTLPPCRDLIESTDRLDIAGVAFDPSGAYMYVATVDGITEWAVQGVEQRWWHTGGCL